MTSTILSVASAKLSELTRPTARGDQVNVHVVQAQCEPVVDFEAMKKTIEGKKADVGSEPKPSAAGGAGDGA